MMKIKGQLYPHIYEPLISKELWDRCQKVRLGTASKPYRYAEKPFVFRGLIRCVNSGKVCTAYMAKGKYPYIVYFDKEGKKKQVREEIIIDKVADILQTVHIPPEIATAAEEQLKKAKIEEKRYRDAEISGLRKNLEATEHRIDSLFELYIDNKIDDEEMYHDKMIKLKAQRQQLKDKIEAHSAADDAFNETVISLFEVINQAADVFRYSSNLDKKRTILKCMILTLEIDDGKLGYALRFPFDLMQTSSTSTLWRP